MIICETLNFSDKFFWWFKDVERERERERGERSGISHSICNHYFHVYSYVEWGICLLHTSKICWRFQCFIRVLRFSVIDPHYQSSAEMYAVIDTLTNQDLQQVLAEFRQSIKADVMVVGNVTPKVDIMRVEFLILNYQLSNSSAAVCRRNFCLCFILFFLPFIHNH